MFTTSAERVSANTCEASNERIFGDMQRRIEFYAQHPEFINLRLEELDREWDIERVIETHSPAMAMLGIVMSVFGGRKWLLLSIFAETMVMTHALQGYCPSLPVLRRAGFRTQREMAEERYALRALRGDFDSAADTSQGLGERATAAVSAAKVG